MDDQAAGGPALTIKCKYFKIYICFSPQTLQTIAGTHEFERQRNGNKYREWDIGFAI